MLVSRYSLSLVALVVLGTGREARADTCVTSPSAPTQLCVGWSQIADPVQGTDFFVVHDGAGTPSVYLRTGDLDWRISNTNLFTGAPANMGQIALRPNSPNEDFAISIGTTAAPGARDVTGIDLRGQGSISPFLWTGWSRLNGGRITGDVKKGILLRSDAAAVGGDLTDDFLIEGSLSGKVAMTLIDNGHLGVFGKSDASIAVTRMDYGSIDIGSTFAGSLVCEKEMIASSISLGGDVDKGALVSINEMSSGPDGTESRVRINDGGEPATKDFSGTLLFNKGLPENQFAVVAGVRSADSVIDFNDHDVGGWLEASGGGEGDMIRGGIIRSSGHVWAAAWPTAVNYGTCTFAGMEPFSVLETETSQNAGTFHIKGDMDGQMWARVSELLETGVYRVDGDVGPTGSILTSSWSQFNRPGDMKGRVEIAGDVYGYLEFAGSVTDGASIDVGGVLHDRLEIGNETHANSSIRLGGLGSGGRILLTSNNPGLATAHDVNGVLEIGDFQSFSPPVVFDGCIRTYSNAFGGGGDLDGLLHVRGCHATADDLNICLDGALNGSILISQFGCTNQVTWSCSGCP